MKEKKWVVLRALLGHFHPDGAEGVLSSLSQEEVQKVLSQEISSDQVNSLLLQPAEIIGDMHYSWLEKSLERFPESLQPFLVSALPQTHQEGLVKRKGFNNAPQGVSSFVRRFLLKTIYQQLGAKDVLPLSLLPEQPLSPFVHLNKEEMLDVMDLLGLYDIASEVRMVIDKKILKQLYKSLSKKKQQYLRKILNRQDKVSSPPMGLDQWGGNEEKLGRELHRRGMIRLGKALSGMDSQLFWHISHRLDTGRSAFISRYRGDKEEGVTRSLGLQVLSAINFHKQYKEEKEAA